MSEDVVVSRLLEIEFRLEFDRVGDETAVPHISNALRELADILEIEHGPPGGKHVADRVNIYWQTMNV